VQDITLDGHRPVPVTPVGLTLFDRRYYPPQGPRANAREMRRTLTKQSSTSEDACTGMIWVGRALARAAAGQVSPRARL